MSAVGDVALDALDWVLLGYVVVCVVIFACLMTLVFAALLGWEPRRRMPTNREWEQTMAAWTREVDERNGKKRGDA